MTWPGARDLDGTRVPSKFVSWLRRYSFRARVSALAAAAVAVAIALAAVLSYVIVAHQLTSQVSRALHEDAGSLTKNAEFLNQGQTTYICYPHRLVQQIEESDNDIIQFIDGKGNIVQLADTCGLGDLNGNSNAALPSPPIPTTAADRRVASKAANTPLSEVRNTIHDATIERSPYRVLTQALGPLAEVGNPNASLGGLAVQIAHPMSDTDSTLTQLRVIMTLVGLFGVALAVMLGLAVASATIRPVKRLTAAAEHVAATQNLAAHIDEEGNDELARLAHAFNAMLGALASSRRQQAQLISDAGHELRTPLTSLRTNIEVLMRVRELPEADRIELLGDVRAQLDELTTLVGDVVDMARQDEVQVEPTEVRLDELVERSVDRARRRNSSLTFDVELEIGSVRAQPALLERAVLNVLDNAAKFSPAGGTVEVRLHRSTRWLLDIRDHGPGIAPEDLGRVFDRFYRAPSARSLPGSGLGLSIVQQVVTSHGGSVGAFLPPDGGTLVHIELPIVSEDEPEAGPATSAPFGGITAAIPPPPPPPSPAAGIPAAASTDR